MKLGFVCSTFDLFHAGHVSMLKKIRVTCDELWIGLQTTITDRPEKNKPIQTVFERYTQLDALGWIDKIIPYESEADLLNLISIIPPHIRYIGQDYYNNPFTGKSFYDSEHFIHDEEFEKVDTKIWSAICYIPRTHTWSSTELRARIANAEKQKEKDASNGNS